MTRRSAQFCPDCGAATGTCQYDGRTRRYCPDCEAFVWQHPAPTVRTVVLDGDAVLLVRTRNGRWGLPGGYLEVEEHPRDGAVRELAEETGLVAPAGELALVWTDHHVGDPAEGGLVSISFAVDRRHACGNPGPGAEVAALDFVSIDRLDAHDVPAVVHRRLGAAAARLW